MFTCGFCQTRFETRQALTNHQAGAHQEHGLHTCFCRRTFDTVDQLALHQSTDCEHPHSREPRHRGRPQQWQEIGRRGRGRRSAFNRHLYSVFIPTFVQATDPSQPPPDNRDPLMMASRGRARANQVMARYLAQHPTVKINLVPVVFYRRGGLDSADDEVPFRHLTQGFGALVHNMESFQTIYEQELARAARRVQDFEEVGSGLTISSVSGFWLNMFHYPGLRGGSYLPTPESILHKQAVINVRNLRDHNCLKHALSVGLMYHRQPEQCRRRPPSKLAWIDPQVAADIDLEGLARPIIVADMGRVEEKNPKLAINVLVMHTQAQAQDISVLRVSPRMGAGQDMITINLLLLYNDEMAGHYVYVKDLDRLVARTVKKSKGFKWCIQCQQWFSPPEARASFEAHLPCRGEVRGRLSFPEGDIEFKRQRAQMRMSWVVYADFESKLIPVEGAHDEVGAGELGACDDDDDESRVGEHGPCREPQLTVRSRRYREFLQTWAYPQWHTDPHQPPNPAGRAGEEAGGGEGVGEEKGEGGVPMKNVIHKHELVGYCLVVLGPTLLKERTVMAWTGPGVQERLVRDLYRIQDMIEEHRDDPEQSEIPLQMTEADEASFQAATHCYLCHERFGHPYLVGLTVEQLYAMRTSKKKAHRAQSKDPRQPNYVPSFILKGYKVRDHDHDTGMK